VALLYLVSALPSLLGVVDTYCALTSYCLFFSVHEIGDPLCLRHFMGLIIQADLVLNSTTQILLLRSPVLVNI